MTTIPAHNPMHFLEGLRLTVDGVEYVYDAEVMEGFQTSITITGLTVEGEDCSQHVELVNKYLQHLPCLPDLIAHAEASLGWECRHIGRSTIQFPRSERIY